MKLEGVFWFFEVWKSAHRAMCYSDLADSQLMLSFENASGQWEFVHSLLRSFSKSV